MQIVLYNALMNVITLNTWGVSGPHQKRWDRLIDELRPLNPDVLFLQEVWKDTLIQKIKMELHFEHSVSSFEPGLSIVSRYPLVSEEAYRYQASSPLETYDRRLLSAQIRWENRSIVLANTHLSWRSEDGPTRVAQTKEMIEQLAPHAYALLAGDLNDHSESAPLRILKQEGYCDLFEIAHPGSKAPTWDNRNPFIQGHKTKFPDRRIDFLFASEALLKEIELISCGIVFNTPDTEGIYASDHYGVFAETKRRYRVKQ